MENSDACYLTGYKLWIKTTFSPEVMRSTLIGQCFHTCEEKMHKAIFDLFQPFLQVRELKENPVKSPTCSISITDSFLIIDFLLI